MNAAQEAQRFIQNEGEFQLGFLVTEQRHPLTMDFSDTVKKNTVSGIAQLLAVDEDLPVRAREIAQASALMKLGQSIEDVTVRGGTICFSGCGSTGRLSILLESMWRRFWNRAADDFSNHRAKYLLRAQSGYSIMTGGDRALIKSVESFEDYQTFGRRQVADAGLGPDDLLIAITEGGETSSVIGTAWEALDRGCDVFFIFNNPRELLADRIARCRKVISERRITKIDLTTGPMALSGSTRMQATSMQLFVIGAVLEQTCCSLVQRENPTASSHFYRDVEFSEYVENLSDLLEQIRTPRFLEGVAGIVDTEVSLYRNRNLVNYISDIYLLDIFSDTTERSPTFMVPPFRGARDLEAPESWAFAKDPLRSTDQAWVSMLQREPRGLMWDSSAYSAMKGPGRFIDNPPTLDLQEIQSYHIGREKNEIREKNGYLFFLDIADDRSALNREAVYALYNGMKSRYSCGASVVQFGGTEATGDVIHLPLRLPDSGMYLLTHVAFKLSINAMSTATMGILGRIEGNYMVQVDATNKKLIDRAARIIRDLKHVDYLTACTALFTSLNRYAEHNREHNKSHVLSAMELIDRGCI